MQIDSSKMTQIARIFNALGNPTRLTILQMAMRSDRPLHIRAFSRAMKLRYTAVYRHVRVLRNAGLVTIYEVGRSRVVAVKDVETINSLVKTASLLIKQ